jgi:hypothetical protein
MSRKAYVFVWGTLPMVVTAIIGGITLYWRDPIGSYERLGFFLASIPMAIIFGYRRGVKLWNRRSQPMKATEAPHTAQTGPKPPNYVKITILIALAVAFLTTSLIWWLSWLQSLSIK